MSYPKISVITPSFNQGEYIEQTIKSVVDQNYPNLEFIIIDGGSNDETGNVIKKYEKYISYWVSEKDRGQGHALNKGLAKATGDIIAWINSDDYYEPGAFHKIGQVFRDKPEVSCFIGKIRFFRPDSSTYCSNEIIYDYLPKTIGFGRITQPAIFFSGSAAKKMGLVSERLSYCMDLDWWIKYLLLFGDKDIYLSDDIVVNFRIHSHSKTGLAIKKFPAEKDAIYYSIAKQAGHEQIASVIRSNPLLNINYTFDLPDYDLKNSLVEESLNYFMLYRGNEFYVDLDRKKARQFFEVIDKNKLRAEDRNYLEKIDFRNKYVPTPVIKLFRKK